MKNLLLAVSALFLAVTIIGCKGYAKFRIDEHSNVRIDTDLIGIWKMEEDTDAHNFFVIERLTDYRYAVTYMNKGGSNRVYENWGASFSKIGNTNFFNVAYRNIDWETMKTVEDGFIFLKVTDISKGGWDMTLALVSDSAMKECKSTNEVRERITKNINNPDFYYKPVHFHKILPLMYCK